MNILHVVNIPFVIPYFLGKQLVFFSDKGYKEHIICSSSDELPVMAKKFHFEYGTVEILRKFSIWKDLKAVKNTFSYINSRQIDIVTGHTPKGALVAMLAAYTARVPKRIYFRHGLVYETSHGMKRKLLIAMDRLAAWMATKVVCVSPSVYKRSIEDRLNSTLKQIVLSKGTCNGIDVGRFCKDTLNAEKVCSLRKQYDIPCGCFVVGFTSHLVLDCFNRKRVRILYPLPGGIALDFCKAGGFVDSLLFKLGSVAVIFEIVYQAVQMGENWKLFRM